MSAAAGIALWLRRYGTLVRAAWLVDLQYRAAIAIWMLWGVVEPLVALGIWWSIAAGGDVQGYERADFVRYFFGIVLVNQLTIAWDAWYLDRWIRGGELNFRLVRPLAPIHEAVADNLAFKMRGAVVLVGAWLAVAAVWPAARLAFDPGRWLLTALAIVPAAGIRFLNGYASGLAAFWITRATSLMELQYGLSLFLAGRIAPLELLPPGVESVARVLWFPYMLAFPVEVLTGRASTPGGYLGGLAMQLGWLVIWWGLYRLLWRRGLRRYAAVGG